MIKLTDIINEIQKEKLGKVSIYSPNKMMPEEIQRVLNQIISVVQQGELDPMEFVQLYNTGSKWMITRPGGSILVYDENEPEEWKHSPGQKSTLKTISTYRGLNNLIANWIK